MVNEGAGTRTQDLRLKRPLLYLLSYASAFRGSQCPSEKVVKSTIKIKNIKKKQKKPVCTFVFRTKPLFSAPVLGRYYD